MELELFDALERNRYLEQQNLDLQREIMALHQRLEYLTRRIADSHLQEPLRFVFPNSCQEDHY